MNNAIDLINFAGAVGGLIVAVLGLILSLAQRYTGRWDRRYFVAVFSLLVAYTVADLTSQITLTFSAQFPVELSRVAVFLESFLSGTLMPLLTLHLLHCAGRLLRRDPWLYAALGLYGAYVVLLAVTQFTQGIYYFTPDNVYHRGPWYPVLLAPPALLMLLNLSLWVRRRRALSSRQRLAILVYITVPLLCMMAQMVSYGLLFIVLGTSLSAFVMFLLLLLDQMESYVRQVQENARQRANIMVLQMRPHFIYNTMMSIYYLCGQDPSRAQQVTLDFTTYLRRNFTALAKEETIPFTEELEHTRAYLAVEQVRFEGRLFVTFDTPWQQFRLPPLTLQPVVENAVKHGVDPELRPLHITIRTRETDAGSEIVVEDTGPGFRPEDSDSPHVALENIRARLAMMCRGSITVATGEQGGAAVTIFVPAAPTNRS